MITWDSRKAASNLAKHGVSFDEASGVFLDPEALDCEDARHSDFESRFQRLGKSSEGRVLLVAYTIRIHIDGKETYRIISARQASRRERAAYAGLAD